MLIIKYTSNIFLTRTVHVCPHHEITTRKKFGPTKYPREKLRTHEGTVARWYEAHETHDGTRPTKFSTLKYTTDVQFLLYGNSKRNRNGLFNLSIIIHNYSKIAPINELKVDHYRYGNVSLSSRENNMPMIAHYNIVYFLRYKYPYL